MIKAELSHNPYLLITRVKFNDRDPKINSQIEKYMRQPLKDWVSMIPEMFYEEMNGYDFDFYFTGTESDFAEVMAAFKNAGVSHEQVRLFYRNEIEDPYVKSAEIDDLLSWISQHPNRKFDFDRFKDDNEQLFEGAYPFIIMYGDVPYSYDPSVSPESVNGASELTNVNLSGTPILFFIEASNRQKVREDLLSLLERPDVQQNQLFFMIDPELDVDQVTRVISDLGVKEPQVVDGYDADIIKDYIRNYPVSEYIRNAIKVFSASFDQISSTLRDESKTSRETNAEVYKRINILDGEINRLKEADDFFVNRDNYESPRRLKEARQDLVDRVMRWRNKKTKVVGDYEISDAAHEYSSYIHKGLTLFVNAVEATYQNARLYIVEKFYNAYKQAGIDRDFHVHANDDRAKEMLEFNSLTVELLKLKEVTYESPKDGFLGFFKKSGEETGDKVKVVICYYDRWRYRALEIIMPAVDDMIHRISTNLSGFYDGLALQYHEHLRELISQRNGEKEHVSALLSDEEKMLQEDDAWLAEVQSQLQKIERG